MQQINQSFGSGGMSLSFSNRELTEFIQQLQDEERLPTKQAAMHIGQQENSLVWVLGKSIQISAGEGLLQSVAAPYVWLGSEIVDTNSKLSVRDICPIINVPLDSVPLNRLIHLLHICLKHNFICSLVVLGATVMAFHYTSIVELYGGCPIPIACGPSEAGKTTAILAGLSICGSSNTSHYVKGTNAFFLERSSLSTLPYGIDDPNIGIGGAKSKANFLDISELIIDLYNGAKTGNSLKGARTPLSIPIIATNFSIKSDPR